MFPRLQPWIERARRLPPAADSWQAKPIDVLFIGQTSYSEPALGAHRLKFCSVLNHLQGMRVMCIAGRALPLRSYYELSVRAKITISPWGYGELCHRDFEAMLDGSVLIKPASSFLETLGGILENNYIPCAHDGSDLPVIISNVMKRPERFVPRLDHARADVLDWWSEERIAQWWQDELDKQ